MRSEDQPSLPAILQGVLQAGAVSVWTHYLFLQLLNHSPLTLQTLFSLACFLLSIFRQCQDFQIFLFSRFEFAFEQRKMASKFFIWPWLWCSSNWLEAKVLSLSGFSSRRPQICPCNWVLANNNTEESSVIPLRWCMMENTSPASPWRASNIPRTSQRRGAPRRKEATIYLDGVRAHSSYQLSTRTMDW